MKQKQMMILKSGRFLRIFLFTFLAKIWQFFVDFKSGIYNGGLNNGWNLIMENITCGDGNHEWYIEFITRGGAKP